MSDYSYTMCKYCQLEKSSGEDHMRNRIKQLCLISVFAGLILILTGCFAENVDKVNFHFIDRNLSPDENLYIRYEDGTTLKVNQEEPTVTDTTYTYTYSVATERTKKVIGYFVEGVSDGIHYNWMPHLANYPTKYTGEDTLITLDLNFLLDPSYLYKPIHEIAYAKVGLTDQSTGIIMLYDKYDNPIDPKVESTELYVKTDNHLISFFETNNTSNVTDNVYSISSSTSVTFQSSVNLKEYTIPDLKLTVYSGKSSIPIPVYAYDYVPQLDLNKNGIIDIEDVVGYANNPFDAFNNGTKDIPFVLSKISQVSQNLKFIGDFSSTITLTSAPLP
jgi:hypothetical protein